MSVGVIAGGQDGDGGKGHRHLRRNGHNTTAPSSEYNVRMAMWRRRTGLPLWRGALCQARRTLCPRRRRFRVPWCSAMSNHTRTPSTGHCPANAEAGRPGAEDSADKAPGAASAPTPASRTLPPPRQDGQGPALTAVTVIEVKDRGVLVTADGEELRLRGVAVPSVRSRHPNAPGLGDLATAYWRIWSGRTVYIVVESPEKGLDGRSLSSCTFATARRSTG